MFFFYKQHLNLEILRFSTDLINYSQICLFYFEICI